MGEKKVTTRTLPTGEQVFHHPPTQEFPDGRQVLQSSNKLADKLMSEWDTHKRAQEALTEKALARVAEKREKLAAHPAVPAEKRVI